MDLGVCCGIYVMELFVEDGWVKGIDGTNVDYKVFESTVVACATSSVVRSDVFCCLLSGNASLGQ